MAVEDGGRLEVPVQGREGLLTGERVMSESLEPEAIARAIREGLAKSAVIWD
jgi:hypothetical protein